MLDWFINFFDWFLNLLNPQNVVYRYELVPQSTLIPWGLCFDHGSKCRVTLNLIKRENGQVDAYFYGQTCCWECEDGFCACDNRFWPGKVNQVGFRKLPERDLCSTITTDDFKKGYGMNKMLQYKYYLDWLISTYGSAHGLESGDIKIYASYAEPPTMPGQPGVVAGEVVKFEGAAATAQGCKYQITIYRDALVGHTLSELYNTIAHEFKHILQDVEHGVGIGSTDPQYEQEVKEFANYLVPPC